ncbi:ATPase AAA [Pseudothermotoga hypogea DSM 11164 = NBRC 106472]|uniref:ATPase AAA n=1 Tax=Pseudothermotoga hypogea DSM 11164 = NBRC 106472 TaxID=1123384 RepID=A0A0X1KP06_9THEM|nr:ATP-binding protein [Pseudothermotoga hypogea]AJC73038.1 ATPase AAA [Pseudothermotoga hypogea DSM 11164 = NBRC 106472]
MIAFTQVAIPHRDIIEGRLTMDVFAADLWQVKNNKGPIEYTDKDLFFRKTYETKGLRNLIEVAENRLMRGTGDPVIQLQTPFGGGKTHALIALYHKAKEWGVNVVVLDGTAFDAKEVRLWEEMERQLTGCEDKTKGDSAPGKDKLIELLSEGSPVLVLIDEILEYATKAAAIRVGDSNLASQTLAFLQELTGAVSSVGKALVVLTLPSSTPEHYDENAANLFLQLQKLVGRTERIYTPVLDDEIEYIVRKRLFERVDEEKAKQIVDDFVRYAVEEKLLKSEEASWYRERFLKSYPFKPDVIEVLYKRWGSFPTFQRTRGVLRLLALVVRDLIDKEIPFIRLGDFNLNDPEIERELTKHLGPEWESVIFQDITSPNSGAAAVDEEIQVSYKSYKLGSVVSTTIFMYSFSGKGEKGVTAQEIKNSVVYPTVPSSIVDTVLSKLREKLFYLSEEGWFFTNQPNLNNMLISREQNIDDEKVVERERQIIQEFARKDDRTLKVYVWPANHKDVPDDERLKLVVLKEPESRMEFLESCGDKPRVNRNVLFFLCPDEDQRIEFEKFLRSLIATEQVREEVTSLTENQKKQLEEKIKSLKSRLYEELRKYYRRLFVPVVADFQEIDLEIPAFGANSLVSEVCERLRSEGHIVQKIAPVLIKGRYLSNQDYVETKKLYEALLRTPGETRVVSKEVLAQGLAEGVKIGLFGLGRLGENGPMCDHFKKEVQVRLDEGEIVVSSELCSKISSSKEDAYKPTVQKETDQRISEDVAELKQEKKPERAYKSVHLKLNVPFGKVSEVVRTINYLQSRFSSINLQIDVKATGGSLDKDEYENRVKEALMQSNVKIEEEETEPW